MWKLIYPYLFIQQKEPVDVSDQKGGVGSACPQDLRHPNVAESVLGLQHSFPNSGSHDNHLGNFLNTGIPGPHPWTFWVRIS